MKKTNDTDFKKIAAGSRRKASCCDTNLSHVDVLQILWKLKEKIWSMDYVVLDGQWNQQKKQ